MPIRPRPKLHLKGWRKYRGLTQEKLAERMGCDRSFISKVERDESGWDSLFLTAAAEALNCEEVDLLVRDPSQPNAMWSLWDRANEGEKAQIVAVAEAILKTGSKK